MTLEIKHGQLVETVLCFIELLLKTERTDQAEKVLLLFEEVIRKDQNQKWSTSMKKAKKEKPMTENKELFYKTTLDQIRQYAHSELTLETRMRKIQFQLKLLSEFDEQ